VNAVTSILMHHYSQGTITRGLRCKAWFTQWVNAPDDVTRALGVSFVEFEVADIHIARTTALCAPTGSIATLHIKNRSEYPRRLDWTLRCGDTGGLACDDSLRPAYVFQALVFPELRALKLGSELHMNVHTTHCAVRVVSIIWTGKNRAAGQTQASAKQPAEVVCEVLNRRGVCLHRLADLPSMARFLWKQNKHTMGIGHVTEILSHEPAVKRRKHDIVLAEAAKAKLAAKLK
jgi:hypothetical protein